MTRREYVTYRKVVETTVIVETTRGAKSLSDIVLWELCESGADDPITSSAEGFEVLLVQPVEDE